MPKLFWTNEVLLLPGHTTKRELEIMKEGWVMFLSWIMENESPFLGAAQSAP